MELFAKRMTWELDNEEGLSCLFFELEDGYFTLSRKTGAEALRLEMNDPANGQLIDPDCFEYALDNTRFRLNIVRNNRKVLRYAVCVLVTGNGEWNRCHTVFRVAGITQNCAHHVVSSVFLSRFKTTSPYLHSRSAPRMSRKALSLTSSEKARSSITMLSPPTEMVFAA